MSLILYHYVHCPFCVRVRMTLGYLNLDYISNVLTYDDETTPVNLTGKKMLPIMVSDLNITNESLDIIAFLDSKVELKVPEFIQSQAFKEIEMLLQQIGSPIHSLAMPYWMFTPEFNDISRSYYQKKKEEKRGPFSELVKNKQKYIDELKPFLQVIEGDLNPFYKSNSFSLQDILISAHLWGLYIVPEFQFSEKINLYLQSVKKICRFDYHKDFWRN